MTSKTILTIGVMKVVVLLGPVLSLSELSSSEEEELSVIAGLAGRGVALRGRAALLVVLLGPGSAVLLVLLGPGSVVLLVLLGPGSSANWSSSSSMIIVTSEGAKDSSDILSGLKG